MREQTHRSKILSYSFSSNTIDVIIYFNTSTTLIHQRKPKEKSTSSVFVLVY